MVNRMNIAYKMWSCGYIIFRFIFRMKMLNTNNLLPHFNVVLECTYKQSRCYNVGPHSLKFVPLNGKRKTAVYKLLQ